MITHQETIFLLLDSLTNRKRTFLFFRKPWTKETGGPEGLPEQPDTWSEPLSHTTSYPTPDPVLSFEGISKSGQKRSVKGSHRLFTLYFSCMKKNLCQSFINRQTFGFLISIIISLSMERTRSTTDTISLESFPKDGSHNFSFPL